MTLEISPDRINIGGTEIDSNGFRMNTGQGYHNNNIISFNLSSGHVVSFSDLEIQILKQIVSLFFDEQLFHTLERNIGDEAAIAASIRSPDEQS